MLRTWKPREFRALLGMGGGGRSATIPSRLLGQSRQVGGSEAGENSPGGGGAIPHPPPRDILKKVHSARRQPAPASRWRRVVSAGEEAPGTAPCVTAGLGPRGWRAAAATPGPDAGRRWRPLARLRAGRCWGRHRRPGEVARGGLRGPGVSCPAWSPRRGPGGRRRGGRGRSAPGAASHERRPLGRPCCRRPPLSPAGRHLAAPQYPPQSAPSRAEVRAGTAEGWRGAAHGGPRARSAKCTRARICLASLLPAFSRLSGRQNVVACPACGP